MYLSRGQGQETARLEGNIEEAQNIPNSPRSASCLDNQRNGKTNDFIAPLQHVADNIQGTVVRTPSKLKRAICWGEDEPASPGVDARSFIDGYCKKQRRRKRRKQLGES